MRRRKGDSQSDVEFVIVDTNVIVRIVISGRRSPAYKIMTESGDKIRFVIPVYALEELEEHAEELRRKLLKKEKTDAIKRYEERLALIINLTGVFPKEFYDDKILEAKRLARFDEDDAPFIALQLKLKELGYLAPIWTEDTDFLRASLSESFLALDTLALMNYLEGMPLDEVLEDLKRRRGTR